MKTLLKISCWLPVMANRARLTMTVIGTITMLLNPIAQASNAFGQRADVQAFIQQMAHQHGFNKHELTELFNHVTLQPKIIESMTQPFEKKPWDVYKQLFLKPERVQDGIDFWQKNQASLALAEKKYSVPAHIIVSILGVETRYGRYQGTYRVMDSLSTLAFTYPPRSVFFKKELAEFLLLCREQHTHPLDYLGSYAGAIGKPQFMPSSYRYYAADFAGRLNKDLMNDDEAVIASVANYFQKHGWQDHQAIAMPAAIKGEGYLRINTGYRAAHYSVGELKQAGVVSGGRTVTPNKAGLIQLQTQTGSEYWVTYPNFYVITRYNTSPQYALVVYLFAEQLKQGWQAKLAHSAAMHHPKKVSLR